MRSKGSFKRLSLQAIQAPKKWALNGGPFGSKLVQKDYVETGVPVIRGCNLSGDFKFNLTDFVFVTDEKANDLLANNAHPGDVIFTQRGTLGQVGIIPLVSPYPRYVISQSQMKLTVNEDLADPLFIYYCFRSPKTSQDLINRAMSAGVPHINLGILREFEIDLPPLETQRKIASILSAYDDLIENNTRRIKILEEMALMIYREWFVNFRFPGHESVPHVPSPLGEIPQGWEVKNLGELCVVTDYVANGSFASLKENVKYRDEPDFAILIRGTDFNSGWNGKYVHVTEGSYRFLRKSELRPGDIVVTNVGNVGTTFFVPDLGKPMTLGPNSVLVRPHLGANYVFHYLRSDEGQHRIRGITSGVAQPKFNKTEFRSVNVVTPPIDLLLQFDSIVGPIHVMSDKLRASCANLRRTRELLLPRLLSGQINLKEN